MVPAMTQFKKEEAASCRFFFRKENRVLRRSDFQHVYNNSRPVRRSLVHVFILRHDETPPPPTRLGITVTKKAGNAVKRNRARRLVRESFRLMLPQLKPGHTIIVNAMKAATTAPFAAVDQQLREIFRQSGLVKSPADDDADASTTDQHT